MLFSGNTQNSMRKIKMTKLTYRFAYNVCIGIVLLGIGVLIGLALPFDHIPTEQIVYWIPFWIFSVAMWVVGGKFLLLEREFEQERKKNLEKKEKKNEIGGHNS